jgi:hypothetical protein
MLDSQFQLNVAVRPYCILLLLISLSFVLLHTLLFSYHYYVNELPFLVRQLFDLDEENNLPTWWSSFLLLNVAFFVLVSALTKHDKFRPYWFAIAIGFLVLAIDEVAGLHETFNATIVPSWALYGGVLVAVIALIFIPFLRSLDGRLALSFVLSGVVFVTGAIVVEILSEGIDTDSLAYSFAVALEEGLEMLGALMFLYFNLRQMQSDQALRLGSTVD